jgi:hypothetical protein
LPTQASWIPVTSTGMTEIGEALAISNPFGERVARHLQSPNKGDSYVARVLKRQERTECTTRQSVCGKFNDISHSCARHRNPAAARLRRERCPLHIGIRKNGSLFGLPTQAGWIPVTSTGMTEIGEESAISNPFGERVARHRQSPNKGDSDVARVLKRQERTECTTRQSVCGKLNDLRHSCARHRNPAAARLRRERCPLHIGVRKNGSLFGLPTQAGWIPVTSTGMTEIGEIPQRR